MYDKNATNQILLNVLITVINEMISHTNNIIYCYNIIHIKILIKYIKLENQKNLISYKCYSNS